MKLLSEAYKCTKTGIFCHTESVAMTLKIMCTNAHYVTLGSRCKMANSHRVTDLQHTDTSKHTKAALKCHVLHSDIGTIFSYDNLFA